MPPKLRDVIRKVLDAGDMTQAQLAKRLYGSEKRQGKISELLVAQDSGDWEKHWQVCARLVPLAVGLKVINERDLLDIKTHHGSPPQSDHDGPKAGRPKVG